MPGPHADGVIGSVGNAAVNQVASQMGQLSINSSLPTTVQYTQPASAPVQTSDVHTVQSTNPKGNQQPGGKNKKKKPNSHFGQGTATMNESNVYSGGKKDKQKFQFPCNICKGDHLTHQCSKMEDIQ